MEALCKECSQAALRYCKECDADLCGTCDTALHRFKLMSTHARVAVSAKWKFLKLKCSEHQGHQTQLFCVSCDECICLLCKDQVLGSHSSHSMKKLQDVAQDKKQASEDLLKASRLNVGKSKELIEVLRGASLQLTEIADDLEKESSKKEAVVREMERDSQLDSSDDIVVYIAMWDRLQTSASSMSEIGKVEQSLVQRACDINKELGVMLHFGGNSLSKKAGKFEWGLKGPVILNGLTLCANPKYGATPSTFVPALRKEPVVVEEKSGLRDCWEARLVENVGAGHTIIGIATSEVSLTVGQLGVNGRSIGFYNGGQYCADAELKKCLSTRKGSPLHYSVGDHIGLMIDCTESPLLRGFVNKSQVFSVPFPTGTWYPALCVANGTLTVTEEPDITQFVQS
eukprot:TRINITY_DN7359_c0_g2_i4.p1 TRINITY_DN7359_c0_g2~~TRINITY_DN7359_c0_g2_i4.p1  ORF type:complete len:399 (+),score=80.45 TRINITY_DN7359_c0_g2_i4:297-1493(+)